MTKISRPAHIIDDGHAHIQFGVDPRDTLKKYGYCVIENVFNKEFCKETIAQMWDWLRGLNTGIKKDDPTTWSDSNWPYHIRSGMLQHTLGQEEFMWKAREHKNVIEVFSKIHNTNKLLSSFDGANINRPISSGYTSESNDSWLHTDQDIVELDTESVYTSKYYSIQGVANFEDVGDNDGSLFLGVGSHLYHKKLFEWNNKKPKNNWYVLTANDIKHLISVGINFVKVNAPAGSLLLFDSRCFHSGSNSVGGDNNRFRFVIYVSLSPAERGTEKDLELKKEAVMTGRTTSHWSSSNIKIFPLPRKISAYMTRAKNIPKYKEWSDERCKLAGLFKY